MRVLLVSSGSGSRGGGEIFLHYLGQGLAARGHEVLMWIPAHARMDELAEKCAPFANVIRTNYRNTYDHKARSLSTCFNWRTSRRVKLQWEALKPDIIHVNKQNLEDGLDLLRAAGSCAIPSVCTIHLTQTSGYLRAKVPSLRDWIAAKALTKYRGVVVAVQEARRTALADFAKGRLRTQTIFNGVPPVDYAKVSHMRDLKRKELCIQEGEFLVLGLGRMVEQKRPSLFLQAARELRRSFPSARFLWIGDGNLAGQWDDWVAREKLRGIISRVGWQADPLPLLLAGDLLLHVAAYEGLPFAIIEAMAAGLPCAVTSNFAAEIPQFDDRTVLFVDDPSTLAGRLRDPVMLKEIAAEARQLIDNAFSLRAMAEAYEQLYTQTVRK